MMRSLFYPAILRGFYIHEQLVNTVLNEIKNTGDMQLLIKKGGGTAPCETLATQWNECK